MEELATGSRAWPVWEPIGYTRSSHGYSTLTIMWNTILFAVNMASVPSIVKLLFVKYSFHTYYSLLAARPLVIYA